MLWLILSGLGNIPFYLLGILLHYDDINLQDIYFLDPQWLCDVLASVVTIREINSLAKSGRFNSVLVQCVCLCVCVCVCVCATKG